MFDFTAKAAGKCRSWLSLVVSVATKSRRRVGKSRPRTRKIMSAKLERGGCRWHRKRLWRTGEKVTDNTELEKVAVGSVEKSHSQTR